MRFARVRSDPEDSTRSTLFELKPSRGYCTLYDVQDACDVCSVSSSHAQKQACFASFGLDADKVERYYYPVLRLNQQVAKSESAIAASQSRHQQAMGLSALMLLAVAAMKG